MTVESSAKFRHHGLSVQQPFGVFLDFPQPLVEHGLELRVVVQLGHGRILVERPFGQFVGDEELVLPRQAADLLQQLQRDFAHGNPPDHGFESRRRHRDGWVFAWTTTRMPKCVASTSYTTSVGKRSVFP